MNPEKSQPYASNTASRGKKGSAPHRLHNVQQISSRIISLTYFADRFLWWQNRHPYSDHMPTRILVSFLKTHQTRLHCDNGWHPLSVPLTKSMGRDKNTLFGYVYNLVLTFKNRASYI